MFRRSVVGAQVITWVLEKKLKTCSSFVCKDFVEGLLPGAKRPYYFHSTDLDKAMKFQSERHARMFKDSDLPKEFDGYHPEQREIPDAEPAA